MTHSDDDHVVGTILFTDLVGFTEYIDELGDHAALDVLDHQRRLLDEVLIDHAGSRLVKELGDGLMIWFDEDVDAIAAGQHARTTFEQARADAGFPLAVRMGLHRGEVIRRGDDLVGQAVNVAARVSELAGPGELLASAAVVDAAPGPTSGAEPIGPTRVKGVSAPVWLHRIR